jgi:hypothetical protein
MVRSHCRLCRPGRGKAFRLGTPVYSTEKRPGPIFPQSTAPYCELVVVSLWFILERRNRDENVKRQSSICQGQSIPIPAPAACRTGTRSNLKVSEGFTGDSESPVNRLSELRPLDIYFADLCG